MSCLMMGVLPFSITQCWGIVYGGNLWSLLKSQKSRRKSENELCIKTYSKIVICKMVRLLSLFLPMYLIAQHRRPLSRHCPLQPTIHHRLLISETGIYEEVCMGEERSGNRACFVHSLLLLSATGRYGEPSHLLLQTLHLLSSHKMGPDILLHHVLAMLSPHILVALLYHPMHQRLQLRSRHQGTSRWPRHLGIGLHLNYYGVFPCFFLLLLIQVSVYVLSGMMWLLSCVLKLHI